MNEEHIKVEISNVLDLLQIITENVESNFVGDATNTAVKARAAMTVSSLSVVSAHLRHICEGVSA